MKIESLAVNPVYTLGYGNIELAELIRIAEQYDAVVVDIRFRAGSRKRDWNKSVLRDALGNRYRHVRAMGNVNYRTAGAPVQFLDLDAGLSEISELLGQQPVILLCACRDVATCHRKDAAELLADVTGANLVHL